jgi:flagellin
LTQVKSQAGVQSIAATANFSLSSQASAYATITLVDTALDTISDVRADFGTIQNRFESTVRNLQNVAENLSASRSRIMDADFAAETAALTRAQILQQAGTAMLAQANSMPQSVLSLLG